MLGACCPEPRLLDGAGAGDGGSGGAARLSELQRDIFDRHCVTDCHQLASAAAGLQLNRGRSHLQLVQVPSQQISSQLRVLPGDPDRSYLIKKVSGGAGMVGDRMPRLAPPLSTAQVQRLRDWISRGAPND